MTINTDPRPSNFDSEYVPMRRTRLLLLAAAMRGVLAGLVRAVLDYVLENI